MYVYMLASTKKKHSPIHLFARVKVLWSCGPIPRPFVHFHLSIYIALSFLTSMHSFLTLRWLSCSFFYSQSNIYSLNLRIFVLIYSVRYRYRYTYIATDHGRRRICHFFGWGDWVWGQDHPDSYHFLHHGCHGRSNVWLRCWCFRLVYFYEQNSISYTDFLFSYLDGNSCVDIFFFVQLSKLGMRLN